MSKDYYERWKEENVLDKKIKLIRRFYSLRMEDDLIWNLLGISERTWERLKKKYPDIKLAMTEGKKLHEQILLVNLTSRAMDRFYEESSSIVEDVNGKVKKKFVKHKKFFPADVRANIYLLSKIHNIKYNENYEMIQIAKKRESNKQENWSNGNDEDS